MHHHLVDAVRGRWAGSGGAQHHLGTESRNGLVAAVDEDAQPVDTLPIPSALPVGEDRGRLTAERPGARHAHRVLISQEQQCLGAGDERLPAVVLDQRGLQFGHRGRNRPGYIPAVSRQWQVGPAHR